MRYLIPLIIAVICIGIPVAYADNHESKWKIIIEQNATSNNSNSTYWPDEMQVKKNDTIEWINNDIISHTVTSGVPNHPDRAGQIFDSGIIKPGEVFSFKVPSDIWSAYYYYCKIHPWMTGKIDVQVPFLGKSDAFTVQTDKSSYVPGEKIKVSGTVDKTYQKTPLIIQLFDSGKNLLFQQKMKVPSNNTYNYEINTSDLNLATGSYKIKGFYGFPSIVTTAYFSVNESNIRNMQYNANSNPYLIPAWVKNTAKWWSESQISDSDFIKGVQFLVENKIIKVSGSSASLSGSNEIPYWIKNNAGWWANGKISDNDFVTSIEYLVNQGLIKI